MFQKYGSDRVRNLLVDKVESTAKAYEEARSNLIIHDYKVETDELNEIDRQAKRI